MMNSRNAKGKEKDPRKKKFVISLQIWTTDGMQTLTRYEVHGPMTSPNRWLHTPWQQAVLEQTKKGTYCAGVDIVDDGEDFGVIAGQQDKLLQFLHANHSLSGALKGQETHSA
ncbi:hypothetical protein Tco_1149718 [Tanacetum coccineum]